MVRGAAANVEPEPRYAVRRVRNVRIPMDDGITLAADLFMPEAPGRFPVVFDYYPYRKNDHPESAYAGHRYFAERGFVAARIDVRGTGDSDGIALDEYAPREQLDGVAAIAWFAAQPWSNGNVGMFGSSYGGFNSIQVAMHRPPALRAIVPHYYTDRRYTDDCHYKGGAMQMLYDVGTYGLGMVGSNLAPPRPDLIGARWQEIWDEHLKNEPWLLRWVEHQTEDEQWLHGSLCENYGAIECATYLVGGWRDGYVNCTLRTFQALTCPKKLIIGPWLHVNPNSGVPGPAVNFHREMTRFYAYWLRDEDTGIMDEPPITIYAQEYDPPVAGRTFTSGTWRHEQSWPLDRGGEATFHVGSGVLSSAPQEEGADAIVYNPTVGTAFGMFPGGRPDVLPVDQRSEEAHSAVYTTAPLTEPVEILGYPTAILFVESTAAVATFVVRLCDVAPDGTSALITKGVLNATHRESHSDPTPIEPGRVYELPIQLEATSWVFRPGHAIRLSVANADFPNTWPSPEPATSHVHRGPVRPSRLILPTVGPLAQPLPTPTLEVHPPTAVVGPLGSYRVTRDMVRARTEVAIDFESTVQLENGIVQVSERHGIASVDERDPARASMVGRQRTLYEWPNRTIEVRTRGQIESDAEAFSVAVQAEITIDGLRHFNRRWAKRVPRHLL
jgi:putative CocE/NonD family hydrolase